MFDTHFKVVSMQGGGVVKVVVRLLEVVKVNNPVKVEGGEICDTSSRVGASTRAVG